MNALDRIKKAHISIMRDPIFCSFSGVLAMGKSEVNESVPTAVTNGVDKVYNPDFVAKLSDPELRLLVLHESTHVAYGHLHVWQSLWKQNRQLANIACDHFVNLSLMDSDKGRGFLAMPANGVQPNPEFRGWDVKRIFDFLLREQDEQPQGAGGGDGEESDNPDDPDAGGGFDQHDWKAAEAQSAAEREAQAEEIQRAIRQGEIVKSKMQGRGAGGRDGVFGDLLTPKVDWRKVLREFVSEACRGRDESSWARPNRRFVGEGIYLPSLIGTTMDSLAVVIDTSGSVFGSEDMTRFVSELTAIVESVKPSKCHVLYVDDTVHGMQTFEDGQFAVTSLHLRGGGGTDLPVAFDYLASKGVSPTAMVIFTDMYTGYGHQPKYPVLWAATTERTAPYGVTLRVN